VTRQWASVEEGDRGVRCGGKTRQAWVSCARWEAFEFLPSNSIVNGSGRYDAYLASLRVWGTGGWLPG
jgi:hypothetical protein